MVRRLSIWFTPTYSSIEVETGVSRTVNGSHVPDILANMNADDLGVVVAFCRAVCQTVDEPTRPSMFLREVK